MTSNSVYVFVYLEGQTEAVPAGELTIKQNGDEVNSFFVYGSKYLKRPNRIALDPISLVLSDKEEQILVPRPGLSLFGAFRDATPDSWGRMVIEKKLNRVGSALTEIQYMLNGADDRVGALDFRLSPNTAESTKKNKGVVQLEELVYAAEQLEKEQPVDPWILDHIEHGTSMGGARPKAVIEDDEGLWIAKFKSKSDRFDNAKVERATMLLAQECGIEIPDMKLVSLPQSTVLMVKRFDRTKTPHGYTRKHFVSALTMLGKHESESRGTPYGAICAAIAKHASKVGNADMKEQLFRRMVFNILCANTDDHLRNHGFLLEKGGYVLSPAYDIVPSAHTFTAERFQHLSVGNEGRLSTINNALSATEIFGLSRAEAESIVNSMAALVSRWRDAFRDNGVSNTDIQVLEHSFSAPELIDIGLYGRRPGG